MLKFFLNPPSGYTESYYDVGFKLKLPPAEQAQIQIRNTTTGEQLNILGTSAGRIINENTIVCQKTHQAEGFVNLFNDDKMNIRLKGIPFVTLSVSVNLCDENGELIEKLKADCPFYNESESIDGEIIPFTLSVHNRQINLTKHEPMHISLAADAEKLFRLAIGTKDKERLAEFYVYSRIGAVNVALPSAWLYHALRLNKKENRQKKYFFYYMKLEGTTYSNTVNSIPILANIEPVRLTANGNYLPTSCSRINIAGQSLDRNIFLLSDRYFVPTWKEFSSYKSRMPDPERCRRMAEFLHEGQDLRERDEARLRQFRDGLNLKQDYMEGEALTSAHYLQEDRAVSVLSQKESKRESFDPLLDDLYTANMNLAYGRTAMKISTRSKVYSRVLGKSEGGTTQSRMGILSHDPVARKGDCGCSKKN